MAKKVSENIYSTVQQLSGKTNVLLFSDYYAAKKKSSIENMRLWYLLFCLIVIIIIIKKKSCCKFHIVKYSLLQKRVN